MSTYTPIFTKPYEDGFKDRPDTSTVVSASFLNNEVDTLTAIESFLAALQIPEKLSELVNDEEFVKATVSNLANYYLKSETYARTETYTQSEVQALIADAVAKVSGKLNISVVDVLPTSDISTTTFYLVPKETAEEKNLYDEYINTDGTVDGWEFIGGVSTSIDMSDYYKKSEVDALLAEKASAEDVTALQTKASSALYKGTSVAAIQLPSINPVMIMSDLDYSTEEQLTGKRWTDGKPIYQKTIENIQVNQGESITYGISELNIDKITYYNILGLTANNEQMPVPYANTNNINGQAGIYYQDNNLHISLGSWLASSEITVVIEYTKTTDTASSPVAQPKVEAKHVYSTEERVVGTWIDGRPIYEKTFSELNMPLYKNEWGKVVLLDNANTVINCGAYRMADGNLCKFGLLDIGVGAAGYTGYLTVAPLESYTCHTVVVQYTKTTDTATA